MAPPDLRPPLRGRSGAFKGGYFDLARPYESEGEDLVPQVLAPEHRFPQLRETNVRPQRPRDRRAAARACREPS